MASSIKASAAKIKALVFDWDGTVVRTMSLKVGNAGALFAAEYGVDAGKVVECYRRHSGISRRELFDMIARESIGRDLGDLEFTRLSNRFTALNLESYTSQPVFPEGNRAALQWFKGKNFLLFVSSSAMQEEIEALAEHLKIKRMFNAILGSKGPFKKGKAHIDHIRSQYGLSPDELVFIGDEKADVRLAGRMGIMTVGISPDQRAGELREEFADFIVRDLSGLQEILSHV